MREHPNQRTAFPLRGRAAAARQSHKLKVGGSNPPLATKLPAALYEPDPPVIATAGRHAPASKPAVVSHLSPAGSILAAVLPALAAGAEIRAPAAFPFTRREIEC